MSQSIKSFVEAVEKRNPNEPEFLQAVHEVAETVIPFIEENKKYQNLKASAFCAVRKILLQLI